MEKIRKNKWVIAIVPNKHSIFDFSKLYIQEPPEGTYWADPFIIERDGKHYVFYEWYDYDRGRIAYSEIYGKPTELKKPKNSPNAGIRTLIPTLTEPKVIIDQPYHMSFPALFTDDDGQLYMTPEAGMSGELQIWKCVEFPEKWEKIKVVANGFFADPIICKKDGFYHIFTTLGGDHELRIFKSKDLLGDWDLIRSETVLNSRNAGNVFKYNQSRLIRPVQDCVGGYGKAVIFRDIPTGDEIRRLEPDWAPGLTGTHTFNYDNSYKVIDGRFPIL